MINKIKQFFTDKKNAGYIIAGVAGSVFSLAGFVFFSKSNQNNSFPSAQSQIARYASLNTSPAFDFTGVSAIANPAVVHIKTTIPTSNNPHGGNPFEQFFGEGFEMPNQGPQQASGSGVIIAEDGLIVTNNHVIDGATKIEVTLNDKRTFEAELVGADRNTDVAVLRIPQANLPFLKLGNSDAVKVGQWVVAVGNPFNLNSTVTLGIISAIGRNIDLLRSNGNQYAIENFLQTDAAINPGNSGGALVNTAGELIGINTAIASQTGSYAGYGFAIPVNLMKKIVNDIDKYGKVQRAVLGVAIQDVTQQLKDEKSLLDLKGVYIPNVVEGGSGDKAGIKAGDVVLTINGVAVNSGSSLQEEIGKYRPGDKIKIEIRRKGDQKVIEAELLAQDGSKKLTTATKASGSEFMGLYLKNISPEVRAELGIKNGVVVSEVKDGPFKDASIPTGLVITSIGNEPVYSSTGAISLLNQLKGGIIVEGILKGTEKMYAIKLPK